MHDEIAGNAWTRASQTDRLGGARLRGSTGESRRASVLRSRGSPPVRHPRTMPDCDLVRPARRCRFSECGADRTSAGPRHRIRRFDDLYVVGRAPHLTSRVLRPAASRHASSRAAGLMGWALPGPVAGSRAAMWADCTEEPLTRTPAGPSERFLAPSTNGPGGMSSSIARSRRPVLGRPVAGRLLPRPADREDVAQVVVIGPGAAAQGGLWISTQNQKPT